MINQVISDLIEYAKIHLGLPKADEEYATNLLMTKFALNEIKPCWVNKKKIAEMASPDELLAEVKEYALNNGLIEEGEEEFFTSDVLDMLSPRPSAVVEKFNELHEKSPAAAFDMLYDLGVKNDYVKASAIAKNEYWQTTTTRIPIEITINLSKPEKNNKLTAKLRNVSAGYPKCMLCKENVGYVGQGRTRRNMRVIPLRLAGEDWFWQFSPYAYFYQHGIAINRKHTPMALTEKTTRKLLDFVDYAPDYCIGSNAPLPIVGGSILAHEHFQGGKHVFPMFLCDKGEEICKTENGVSVYLPDWYNSVILLEGADKNALCDAAAGILNTWLDYSDESVGIIAKTDAPHNTLSPIARKTENGYQVYLLLRNNRCDETHPDGIFHAHKEYHNIKSESIGLIEAMGRFILPGRLHRQLKEVRKFLTGENTEIGEDMKIHAGMIRILTEKYGTENSENEAERLVTTYVENVCENILDNTAVFKRDEKGKAAFGRFLSACGLIGKQCEA